MYELRSQQHIYLDFDFEKTATSIYVGRKNKQRKDVHLFDLFIISLNTAEATIMIDQMQYCH